MGNKFKTLALGAALAVGVSGAAFAQCAPGYYWSAGACYPNAAPGAYAPNNPVSGAAAGASSGAQQGVRGGRSCRRNRRRRAWHGGRRARRYDEYAYRRSRRRPLGQTYPPAGRALPAGPGVLSGHVLPASSGSSAYASDPRPADIAGLGRGRAAAATCRLPAADFRDQHDLAIRARAGLARRPGRFRRRSRRPHPTSICFASPESGSARRSCGASHLLGPRTRFRSRVLHVEGGAQLRRRDRRMRARTLVASRKGFATAAIARIFG